MQKHAITIVHASPASIAPLNNYYPKAEPALEITNLFDDGVMRLFRKDRHEIAKQRLADMIATGRELYDAEVALLACSAVTSESMRDLRANSRIPLVKIDEPMARLAVQTGSRIGVIVTFPPTQSVTRNLLEEAADGKQLQVVEELVPEALEALIAGDQPTHDKLMTSAAERLAEQQVDAIVLAQVSMANLVGPLKERTGLPVFSSLETSLVEVRRVLGI